MFHPERWTCAEENTPNILTILEIVINSTELKYRLQYQIMKYQIPNYKYQIMKLRARLVSPKTAPVVFLTPDTLPETCFSPIKKENPKKKERESISHSLKLGLVTNPHIVDRVISHDLRLYQKGHRFHSALSYPLQSFHYAVRKSSRNLASLWVNIFTVCSNCVSLPSQPTALTNRCVRESTLIWF